MYGNNGGIIADIYLPSNTHSGIHGSGISKSCLVDSNPTNPIGCRCLQSN